MPNYNIDYLKFDAVSIKNAINQKLSEDSNFSDHLFEGSNLTTIVDIFSHLFEVLMYYTNHGASEAMFSDAQLYENMNRLSKMLGYNPLGNLSSKTTIGFYDAASAPSSGIFDDSSSQKEIPKYSSIDTNLIDSNGNSIYYSLVERLFVSKNNPVEDDNSFTSVNGKWKLYERTFIAGGIPFEEFILNELPVLGVDTPNYISHPYVDVYVKTLDPNLGTFVYDEYDAITEGTIFGTDTNIIGPDSRSYELRINEDGYYTLKFGDDTHGKKLNEGDEVYIIYLEGNGPEGKIGVNAIDRDGGFSWGVDGLDSDTLLEMINIDSDNVSFLVSDDEMTNIHFQNSVESTEYSEYEDVEDIRTNAPQVFKSGNRLVTANDFDSFMKTYHSSDIYDVLTMNNWTYLAEFYKWLYDYNKLTIDIRKDGYEYVDACDFNNVYIWLKYRSTPLDESLIQEELQSRKCLTAEPKIQEAFDTIFVPCLNFNTNTSDLPSYDNLKYSIYDWDPNFENWLEIIKDKNTFVSAEKIRSEALTAIRDFFNPLTNELGQTINFNTLYSSLLSINGVQSVRTAYRENGAPNNSTIYFNGVSMAKWTPNVISGQDIELIKGTIELEKFQFPELLETSLNSRVKIVAESFGQGSIEY